MAVLNERRALSHFRAVLGSRENVVWMRFVRLGSACGQDNRRASRIEFEALLVMCAVDKEPWKLKKNMY